MGKKYLIDTNVVIDNFGGKLPIEASKFLSTSEVIISVVTKVEILGWFGATPQQLKPLCDFIELVKVLPISDEIIEKTIALRQTKKIGLGDAFIAATVLVYDLILVTRNTSDFKNINGLQLVNPYAL